jgi:hypothetical protein
MKFGGHLVAGAVAGAIGTAAMDLLWYRRYRAGGGKDPLQPWEFNSSVSTWDDASSPGQVGRKALHTVLHEDPPDEWARPTTNIVHWATGIGWGIQYALVASKTSRHPWLRALALGPVAWAASYVLLPLAKVYKPIWEYDTQTLAKDLSAHLVFGASASAAFAVLARRP